MLVFGAATLLGSHLAGVPIRDPGGSLFGLRLVLSLGLALLCATADALRRALHDRSSSLLGRTAAELRARWSRGRIAAAISLLIAYHVIYACYRNLKSWNALRPLRDGMLDRADRALFLGHEPAVLLHHALGTSTAATVLALVYRSFALLVPLTIAASTTVIPRLRDGAVFITAAAWAWVLGTITYYLVPAIGPFHESPGSFASLRPTAITATQQHYIDMRSAFIAAPRAHDSLSSIGAFASLHTGFTTMLLLTACWLRYRTCARVLAAYLVLVMVATVYFGWHYVWDDVAGLLLGGSSLLLALLTAQGSIARMSPR